MLTCMKAYLVLPTVLLFLISLACSNDDSFFAGQTEQAMMSDAKVLAPSSSRMMDASDVETDRKIIRSAYAEITVDNVEDTFQSILDLVESKSGYIESSSIGSNDQYRPLHKGVPAEFMANITARIPSTHLDALLAEIGEMALEQPYIMMNSRDVTAEHTDVQIILENLRAVEVRFRLLLDETRTITEILEVQDRLNETRLEIDRYTGRLKYLESQVEMSQLDITIYGEIAQQQDSIGSVVSGAWNASIETINKIFRTALSVIIFSWWIILGIGPLTYLLVRRMRKNQE